MKEGEGVNIDFSRDAVIALHFSVGHSSVKLMTIRLLVPARHLHSLLCLTWDAHPMMAW